MSLGPAAQWAVFLLLAFISVAGGLGMATTMSMFRSGIFLMASFIGVAGLFILLLADLLALLQVMMYIGGMLVMILFMVMFMHDPGGAMMAGMKMAPLEKLFSLGIPPMEMGGEGEEKREHPARQGRGAQAGDTPQGQQGGHEEHDRSGHERHDRSGHEGHDRSGHEEHDRSGHEGHDRGGHEGHGRNGGGMPMDMQEMTMTTPLKRPAALLAAVGALLLTAMLLFSRWPLSAQLPDPDSPRRVGGLLMGKYMMAFEGAGFLILIGIFGAVLLARPGSHPDESGRQARAGVDAKPAPSESQELSPQLSGENYPPEQVSDTHADR